jgi:hypothetical protein
MSRRIGELLHNGSPLILGKHGFCRTAWQPGVVAVATPVVRQASGIYLQC